VTDDLAAQLRASVVDQERRLKSSLVLNPVENIPFEDDLAVVAGPLHGLYNSDKVRTREQHAQTPIQFGGRQTLASDARQIYTMWAQALGAADATLRLLSGLHAHIVLFMAMSRPGQSVLLLPVEGGGHLSARAILERLGLVITEMVVDDRQMCVDIDRTLDRCATAGPDFIFVDRSEGLVFEDFTWLAAIDSCRTVFDSSQYLTNIICGDHPNPFESGFDLMVASVHKNFPGPQKALLATRSDDDVWKEILRGVSTYVSNMHSASIYAAGLTLARTEWLAAYSRAMLTVAVRLEDALLARGVPVVLRRRDMPATHHVWIRELNRELAFTTYERLERCRIMTNFRRLPYSLGHGLRLGVSAAVRLGLCEADVPALADLIAEIRARGATPELRRRARTFSETLWARSPEQRASPATSSGPIGSGA
jgi:glycine hydroxymethyltransferase